MAVSSSMYAHGRSAADRQCPGLDHPGQRHLSLIDSTPAEQLRPGQRAQRPKFSESMTRRVPFAVVNVVSRTIVPAGTGAGR